MEREGRAVPAEEGSGELGKCGEIYGACGPTSDALLRGSDVIL